MYAQCNKNTVKYINSRPRGAFLSCYAVQPLGGSFYGDCFMKRIKLTQGKFAIVDDADFEWLNRHKWYACKSCNTFYVARSSPIVNGKRTIILMHREILGLGLGDKRQGDHKNHHGLDNRRDNLRIATCSQNHQNEVPRRNFSSAFKGVSWRKRHDKWQAKIQVNGKIKYLGCFDSETEAARVYNRAAKELFGEFARLNQVL